MSPDRPHHQGNTRTRGSALLAVMCFATVLALALTTFQALCNQTLKTSNRNAQSTHAIELAEMGLECAVWSRTNAIWTTAAGGIANWTISGSTASTTLSGTNYNFSNGVTGSVTISVTNYNGTNTTTSVLTSTGTATLADGSTVTRILQATLEKAKPFSNAVAATASAGTVQLLTGGQTVDSYTVPASPTIPVTFTYDYNAVVTGYSVSMANSATVNGYIATPANGSGVVALTYTTGSSGSKLKGPSTSGTLNIDTTRQSTNPYQQVFDIPNPTISTVYSQPADATALAAAKVLYGNSAYFALAEPAASTDVYLGETGSTTYYRATLGATSSSYYYLNNSNGRLIIDGTSVVIVIPGYFYINTSGSIIVRNGGSLRILLQGGGSIYYAGIDNQTKRPKNLSIIGTGTSTVGYTLWVWSYSQFYGTIYAPRHAVRIWGYNATSEFFGSIVASSVIIDPYSSSALKTHYDKDLASEIIPDVSTPYVIQSGTLKEVDSAGNEL
jgi:hypothetical protein